MPQNPVAANTMPPTCPADILFEELLVAFQVARHLFTHLSCCVVIGIGYIDPVPEVILAKSKCFTFIV